MSKPGDNGPRAPLPPAWVPMPLAMEEVAEGKTRGATAQGNAQAGFAVELTHGGPNKIAAIKAIREVTGLGLKDAKDLVDDPPREVKAGLSEADAEDIARKLREVGAGAVVRRR